MNPATPPGSDPAVAELSRIWADAAAQTTYLPMSAVETELFLEQLIIQLVSAVTATPLDEQAVMAVAAELVAHDVTGSRSVSRSIEILIQGLPRLPQLRDLDGLVAKLFRVTTLLAAGYADKLRRRTLEEQEQVAQALLHAKLEAEAWFQEVFMASPVGIVISNFDGVVSNANHAFAEIVGLPVTDLIGATLPTLLSAENDATLATAYRDIIGGVLPRFWYAREVTAASGETAWTHLGTSLLRDASGTPTHHLTIVENITELPILRQEFSRQALNDTLTGLPNEQLLMSRLEEVLGTAEPTTQVTLCRLNLDNFSIISDGIGPDAGERVLRSVAHRLSELVRGQPAMVARLSRDDFAILIEDGPRSPEPSTLGPRINEALSEPVYYDNRGLALSASSGIVRLPAHGLSATELLRAANSTMHRARRLGGGQWGLHDPDADAQDWAIYQQAAEMPGAFENGEIALRYQPVCELESGRIRAIQALLSWKQTDGTVVEHPTCLALAERSGLLGHLGRWMLRESLRLGRELTKNPSCGAPPLRVDLTSHLCQDPDLVGIMREVLFTTELPANQLRLGLPLTTLARDHGDVLESVDVLADLGIEMVLVCDTANPEYLAYLEDLPLRVVELSPGVVSRIAARPGEDSVVAQASRQSVPLMHGMGAIVIVPGVDTPDQVQWWLDAGVDLARGAYFSPPVGVSELPALLESDLP